MRIDARRIESCPGVSLSTLVTRSSFTDRLGCWFRWWCLTSSWAVSLAWICLIGWFIILVISWFSCCGRSCLVRVSWARCRRIQCGCFWAIWSASSMRQISSVVTCWWTTSGYSSSVIFYLTQISVSDQCTQKLSPNAIPKVLKNPTLSNEDCHLSATTLITCFASLMSFASDTFRWLNCTSPGLKSFRTCRSTRIIHHCLITSLMRSRCAYIWGVIWGGVKCFGLFWRIFITCWALDSRPFWWNLSCSRLTLFVFRTFIDAWVAGTFSWIKVSSIAQSRSQISRTTTTFLLSIISLGLEVLLGKTIVLQSPLNSLLFHKLLYTSAFVDSQGLHH